MSNQEVQTWEEIEADRLIGGIERRIVTGKKVMLGRLTFPKGAIVPAHSHPNEQITFVLSGSLKFIIDKEKEIIVRSGQTIVVPENAEHIVEALEETDEIDAFSPIRTDWLDGSDAYLREPSK